jgi:uncharacterized protein YjdB
MTGPFLTPTNPPQPYTEYDSGVILVGATSLSISPTSAFVKAGQTTQFHATFTLQDASQPNGDFASWSCSDPAVAIGYYGGTFRGEGAGTCTVTASFGSFSATAQLTVGPPDLSTVEVTPASGNANSFAKGLSVPFAATGFYQNQTSANLSNQATWSSSDSTVAAVSNMPGTQGLVTMTGQGTAQISASANGISSNSWNLTVTAPVLQAITLMPVNYVVPDGSTPVQFQATGQLTDGSTNDVTNSVQWFSSDSMVATVDSAGKVTLTSWTKPAIHGDRELHRQQHAGSDDLSDVVIGCGERECKYQHRIGDHDDAGNSAHHRQLAGKGGASHVDYQPGDAVADRADAIAACSIGGGTATTAQGDRDLHRLHDARFDRNRHLDFASHECGHGEQRRGKSGPGDGPVSWFCRHYRQRQRDPQPTGYGHGESAGV